MQTILFVHILGGALGLLAGVVALSAVKGGRLHRTWGMLFVYAMVTMAVTGALIAALTGVETSVIMGCFTAYLVLTALTTVRPPDSLSRRINFAGMVAALLISITCVMLGVQSLMTGEMVRAGMPVPMLFVFGSIALLAGVSDVRVMRRAPLRGGRRLARHLWRMCFALFIASASFFLGQSDKFPEQFRITPLLVILALTPLGALLYWLRQVRTRRNSRIAVGAGSPD